MASHNVVLTDHQESLVEALVQSGRYPNAGEVLREGLRLIERREAADAPDIDALRAAVERGLSAIARGEFRKFVDAESLAAHLDALAGRAASGAKAG